MIMVVVINIQWKLVMVDIEVLISGLVMLFRYINDWLQLKICLVMLLLLYFSNKVCIVGSIVLLVKLSRKCSVFNCSGVVIKDMVKNIIIVQQSVVSRICEVLMWLLSLFNCGVEISVDMLGIVVIILVRKVILLLFGVIDLINSVRIGLIELLYNWIIRVVKNRLIISFGQGKEVKICFLVRCLFLLICG